MAADVSDLTPEAIAAFEGWTANDLLAWGIERFDGRIAISAAGGVDGMAILDMAWAIDRTIRVFTLDTGRLPKETYTLFEKVRQRYGIDVEFVAPDAQALGALLTAEGPELMYRSVDLRLRCCEVRKVEPMTRTLATLDAWVTGLRRDQWKSRRNVQRVEIDDAHGGIVKLNPLVDWSLDQVWTYVREHGVPTHELFGHGYASIGCEPCTRPVLPGEPERSGRWWWETDVDKECGIHCSVQLLGTPSDRERARQD